MTTTDQTNAPEATMTDETDQPPPDEQQAAPAPAPTPAPATAPKTEAIARRPDEAPVPFNPRDTGEMFRYAKFLASSELVPRALQGKPYSILHVLLKGVELGLKPMQALGSIHIIDGKAEIGSHLIQALILRSGVCEYFFVTESSDTSATVETRRRGWPDGMKRALSWTILQADQMGLTTKGKDEYAKAKNPWRLQPWNMLVRRAISALGREVYPDIVMGLYDEGEIREVLEINAADVSERRLPPAAQAAVDAIAAVEVGLLPPQEDQSAGRGDELKTRLRKRKSDRVAGTADAGELFIDAPAPE